MRKPHASGDEPDDYFVVAYRILVNPTQVGTIKIKYRTDKRGLRNFAGFFFIYIPLERR